MKTIFNNTIITQAISLGFDFSEFDSTTTVADVEQALFEYFNENSDKIPQIEDECEVFNHGTSQDVVYGDYVCSGEIVTFSNHWHKSPDTKIFHSDFIMVDSDGLMKRMNLFYYVGQTRYNAPDGYYFNEKTKQHEPIF